MVDLSKISQTVQKFIDEVKASEGKKKQIDTRNEYNQLAQYLVGNSASLNNDEKNFIEGFMIEYETKSFNESVTEATKDAVKDAAKLFLDKKKVDSPVEAQHLVYLLQEEDLKPSDRQYIVNVLINSGFEDMLVDRIAILEERMDINDMINNAQNEAIEANYEIDQLQNSMIIANSEADKELRAEVDAVEAEVDAVKAEVDAVEAEVNAVEVEVDAVKADLDDVQAAVDEQQVSEGASAPEAPSMTEPEARVMAGAEAGVLDGVGAGIAAGVMAGAEAGANFGVKAGAIAGAVEGVLDGVEAGANFGVKAGAIAGAEAGVLDGVEAGIEARGMAEAEAEISSAEPPKLDEQTREAIKAERRVARREDLDMNTPESTRKITPEFVDKLNDALKD